MTVNRKKPFKPQFFGMLLLSGIRSFSIDELIKHDKIILVEKMNVSY